MAIFMISLGWIDDADVEPARRALLGDAEARQRVATSSATPTM